MIVDIYSRYLFEKEVSERRAVSELSAAEINEIMERAQKATYGDGLDPRYLQKYMWTWKPHYYETSIPFYQITDGISQTMLVGEAPEGAHSIWMSTRNVLDQSAPINTPASPMNQYMFTDFGQEISSHHLHGASVMMADASVHFLMERMENRILSALCSRMGGDVIDTGF